MGTEAPTDIITDTSTLINFLRIGRVDLLVGLSSYRFLVTDHVRAEVRSAYQDQLTNLEFALFAGHLVEITLQDPAELAVFAELKKLRLGDGECASIAAALHLGLPLAIDDARARNRASARAPGLKVVDTVGLVVEGLLAGLLSVPEADAIKLDWETNHRFTKKGFTSFAELIP